VPTPTPELADLFATCHFLTLSRRLRAWAIEKRRPWFHLLFETTKEFFPVELVGIPKDRQAASWLTPRFLHQHRAALIGYETRFKFLDRLPSLQINLNTLDALRRQFACYMLPCNPTYERRYPYLDRSLLEFLYAIPPEQLVRPGQRRSLMRRALTGIVPDEVLNRKRKAYVFAGLRETVLAQWHRLNLNREKLASADLGIVDSQRLVHTLDRVARGAEIPNLTLMRTLTMESWLRAVLKRGVLDGLMNAQGQDELLLTKSFRKQRITATHKLY
jgi:asparagine synthase (glutamine-hydrolysing)